MDVDVFLVFTLYWEAKVLVLHLILVEDDEDIFRVKSRVVDMRDELARNAMLDLCRLILVFHKSGCFDKKMT